MSISRHRIRRISRTTVSPAWLHPFDEEADVVGQVVLGMTHLASSSVDDRNATVSVVHPEFDARRKAEFLQHVASRSGAVVMSRNAFDQAGGDLSDFVFQMPVFVLTRRIPIEPVKGQNDRLQVSFVGEGIECAVERARAAAGGKDVAVIGDAETAQMLIRAALVDDLNLDVVPVLLGHGLRFFQYEVPSDRPLEHRVDCASGERIGQHFRVIKPTVRLQPARFAAWA